jgi:ribosome-interacting GTPase 1
VPLVAVQAVPRKCMAELISIAVGFDVAKTGVARVGFIGFPSVGKSTLMSKLTGTHSEVGAYEFTVRSKRELCACAHCADADDGAWRDSVQGRQDSNFGFAGNYRRFALILLPSVAHTRLLGAKDGKGRGRQVIAVARTCSLIFMVLDVMKPLNHKRILEKELEGYGLRLNAKPPNIYYKKKEKGGINITTTIPGGLTNLDNETIKSIMSEYKIHNADLTFRCDASEDELIDVISDMAPIYVRLKYEVHADFKGALHLRAQQD